MTAFVFEVLGTPAPKGSTHARLIRGRAVNLPAGSSENRRKLRHWDTAIRETARELVGLVEAPPFVKRALVFEVVFRLARPGGHYSKATGKLLPSAPAFPIGKPDGDKLARQAADSLATIVFDDDSRIVSWRIDKVYATPGNEGATFKIYEPTSEPNVERELAMARKVGELWRTQEGVNGADLDELAEATRP